MIQQGKQVLEVRRSNLVIYFYSRIGYYGILLLVLASLTDRGSAAAA
jgi:hypothetical protein